jgi:hypothetical protein
MAMPRNDDEERAARIDMILEDLRLNSEDLQALARRAIDQARKMRADNRVVRASLGREPLPPAAAKKPEPGNRPTRPRRRRRTV